jgi:glycosyltransferase involved in cell wall biosynthesis
MNSGRRRVAVIVSHPIQYFAPLHQRLAQRNDIKFKVFFTWHAGEAPIHDRGFARDVAWDIPLTTGYCYELVPNTAADPGMHSFFGLHNPTLIDRVTEWQPDTAIIHGWAWRSHLRALRDLPAHGIRTLLRGDSHLLGETRRGLRWRAKHALLTRIFRWPSGFLVTGSANRAYYEAFGVPAARLHPCPHSIDAERFAEPSPVLEAEAACWRRELGIVDDRIVVLYAGKFEPGKRPVELARAVLALERHDVMMIFVGGGELQGDIEAIAATHPDRVRMLPFQNQTRMPIVYRLGDVFVLPSTGESWGLAVNEALAASRPVLVSDRVGCAADVVAPDCGRVFPADDLSALRRALDEMTGDRARLAAMRGAAAEQGRRFDTPATEAALMAALDPIGGATTIERKRMPPPAKGAF